MLRQLRRMGVVYSALGMIMLKQILAYSAWFWVDLLGQLSMMTVFVFFWKAVYASGSGTVGGMQLQQTINYILLARMLAPMFSFSLVLEMGGRVRDGQVATDLLRPVDFQGRMYAEVMFGALGMVGRLAIPLSLVAVLFFGLHLPADPAVWGAFLVSFLLGTAVMFCFEFLLACLAFYTTEVWGVHVLKEAVIGFFSGALVPLMMLPDWLQKLAAALPFGQALYVPLTLLTGIAPAASAPRVWLVQAAWLIGLAVLSRLVWNVAVRKVTVQGG